MMPPAERPQFEPLTEEAFSDPDQAFLEDYQQVSGIQQEDLARKDLLKQLRLVEEALSGDQPVFLPEVGTFQRGKDDQLTFEPAAFNYYLDVYGLGPVTARPVLRRTPEEAARVAQEERSRVIVRPQVKMLRSWKDRLFLPGLATLLILSIAGCLWLIFSPGEDPGGPLTEVTIPENEISPDDAYSTTTPGDITEDLLEDQEVAHLESDTAQTVEEEERYSPPPAAAGVRIAVGHFGNPENVVAILDRLRDAGFTPGSEPARGSLTRVFITVNPDVQSPREALTIIQREFEPTAWILND